MRKILYENREYPQALKNIEKPPKQLYYEGNIELLNKSSIAVIGSRCCSEYGVKQCEKFTEELTEAGLCIISGMAKGIDTVAHSSCLKLGGKTIAVLGCGLSKIFPKENIYLYKEIIYNEGLVISEYEPEVEANTKYFPERNRIVSGLSIGTLVIESAYRSGTSITAKLAIEQGKKVFCVPHNLELKTGVGNNKLIQNGAKLVTSAEDILVEYNLIKENERKTNKIEKEVKVSDEYKDLYEILTYEAVSINKICKKMECKISEINYLVTMMEMENLIEVLPGNMIKRKE